MKNTILILLFLAIVSTNSLFAQINNYYLKIGDIEQELQLEQQPYLAYNILKPVLENKKI